MDATHVINECSSSDMFYKCFLHLVHDNGGHSTAAFSKLCGFLPSPNPPLIQSKRAQGSCYLLVTQQQGSQRYLEPQKPLKSPEKTWSGSTLEAAAGLPAIARWQPGEPGVSPQQKVLPAMLGWCSSG